MRRDLDALAAGEHDVLVVGGGIHGAATAWEAASRGLSVALLEADDFGARTSWNSLKTIHGGLRHLQRADVVGLRESAHERRALLTIAPGLVRPLPVLVPAYGFGLRGLGPLALAAGLTDLLTRDRNDGVPEGGRVPPSRRLTAEDVRARVPGIAERGLTGGVLWFDAQVTSSERLLMAILHAAAGEGARMANHAEATAILREGHRVTGVRMRDAMTGAERTVRARVVVNAAGPAADDLLRQAGVARPAVPHLLGVNLVFGRPVVRDHALAARGDDRYLFLAPWRGRSIVGTAYAAEGTAEALARTLLDEARRAYPWAGLEAADVTLVHAGRVPGRSGAGGLVSRSRVVDHASEDRLDGLLTIVGVKFTTARAVAQRSIDLVCRRLRRPFVASRTATTPLAHAQELSGPLADRVRHTVREEMALTAADVVRRRLDLATTGPPEPSALDVVMDVMAAELGWDDRRRGVERASAEQVPALRSAPP